MKTLKERFDKFVVRGRDCWLWSGCRTERGYGRFSIGGKKDRRFRPAHRVSHELYVGVIPLGLSVCHRCDNPPCVRPSHLFLGTQDDNMKDAAIKGRTIQGERHPKAKLTQEDVRHIRALRLVMSHSALARKFGIDSKCIRRVLRGEAWRSVD
jgi:hypothetical protein